MRGGRERNEELASVRVRSRICHAHHAGFVEQQIIRLIVEKITGVAAPGPGRVARLRRKAGDDAVKRHAVEPTLPREEHE